MTTTEPTVEECLKELREMFPGRVSTVMFSTKTSRRGIVVSSGWKVFYGDTLNEAMAQGTQVAR